jgi:hypothetical protein
MLKPKFSKADANLVPPRAVQLRETTLAAFDQTKEAQRLERLEADKELVLQLMLHGYAGGAWRIFSLALAEYGLQVMKAWIATGRIFEQCKRKGRGVPSGKPLRDQDDVTGLAGVVVAEAINAFRDHVLVPGKWDPNRGASLKTFFIGQCVLRFPNEYRKWTSSLERAPAECSSEVLVQRSAPPDKVAELRRVLASLPNNDAGRIAVMTEMGFTQAEIARSIGVTKRSVDSKLYRARRQGVSDGR